MVRTVRVYRVVLIFFLVLMIFADQRRKTIAQGQTSLLFQVAEVVASRQPIASPSTQNEPAVDALQNLLLYFLWIYVAPMKSISL